MGFCFFSNVAVAAKYACERHGVQRVAIIDFDVHHGNGTEDIVAGDELAHPDVQFLQHPFYPEGGSTRSDANLVNCPCARLHPGMQVRELPRPCGCPGWRRTARAVLFISAGFDAHREDDMGQLRLVRGGLRLITQIIRVALAPLPGSHRQLPGGWLQPVMLARSVEAHVRVLADLWRLRL